MQPPSSSPVTATAWRWLRLLLVVLVVSLASSVVHGYPGGAPSGACNTRNPKHGGSTVTPGTGGYQIQFPGQDAAAPTYTSPVPLPIRITLDSSSDTPWMGHLISVYSARTNTRVGALVNFDSSASYFICEDSTLTQSNASGKTVLDVTWQPPEVVDLGDVIVRVTLVQEFSTWFKLETSVREVAGTNPPNVMSAPIVLDAQPSATAGFFDITVGWTKPINGSRPILEYILKQSTDGGEAVIAYRGMASSIVFTDVPSNTTLRFTVTANNTWTAADSAPLLITVPDASALPYAAPVGLELDPLILPLPSSVTMRWTANNASSPQFVGYELQVKLRDAPVSSFATAYFGMSNWATVDGLLDSSDYVLRVRSKSLAGDGPWSAEVSVQTAGCGVHGRYLDTRCICEDGYLGKFCEQTSIYLTRQQAPPCFNDYTFCLDFTVANDVLYARIQGRLYPESASSGGHGWMALGFGAEDGMTGGEMYVFSFLDPSDKYAPRVQVLRADGYSTPGEVLPDVVGEFVDGLYNDTGFDIRFQRPLNPANGLYVLPAAAGKFVPVSWAQAPAYFDIHPSSMVGRLSVDFVGGVVRNLSGEDSKNYAFYAPVVAAVGAIVLAAALLQCTPFLARSALGECCLRKRPSTWLLSSTETEAGLAGSSDSGALPGAGAAPRGRTDWYLNLLDFVTFDIRSVLWNWTFGDYFVFVTYALGLTVSVLVGYASYDPSASFRSHYVFGHLVALQFALVFLPVNRGGLWLYLMGISYERAVQWHRIMARICVGFLVIHIISMTNQFGRGIVTNMHATPEGYGAGWGSLAFLTIALMSVLALEPVRRRTFELFYFTHLLLFPAAVFFACMHNVLVRYYLFGTLGLIVLDRLPRRARTFADCKILSIQVLQGEGAASAYGAEARGVPRLVRLEISKPSIACAPEFKYGAGDYAFVSIPALSWLAWHPFSLTSNPLTSPTLTFHIMDMGAGTFTHELTHKLADTLAGKRAGSKANSDLLVRIDGPYGNLTVPTREYASVVLVAGGIGITPLYSLLQALLHDQDTLASSVQCIHLVWVSRAPAAFSQWFPELLLELFPRFRHVLHLHFYYTGKGAVAGQAPAKDLVDGKVTGASTSRRNTAVEERTTVQSRARLSAAVGSGAANGQRGSVAVEPLPFVDASAEARGRIKSASVAPKLPSSPSTPPSDASVAASAAAPRASVSGGLRASTAAPRSSSAAKLPRAGTATEMTPRSFLLAVSSSSSDANFDVDASSPPPPPPPMEEEGFEDAERASDEETNGLPPPPPPAPLPPSVPAPLHASLLTSNPIVSHGADVAAASHARLSVVSPSSDSTVHDELASASPVSSFLPSDEEVGAHIHIHTGRPPMGAIFAQIQLGHQQLANGVRPCAGAAPPRQTTVAVFACGPRELCDEAQNHAMRRGWHLHKETFLL